jgi:hypothetical protein
MRKRYLAAKAGFLLAAAAVLCCSSAWAGTSIVLRVAAVNPSKIDAQAVPVKVYLPREVKPDDVLNRAELEMGYDTQQGAYYLYGEYKLKPGESLEKEVEIRDIWLVPATEIDFLRQESHKLAEQLKNTDYADRVSFLTNSIDSKLNVIIESQADLPSNPERHISDYRENLRLLESIKTDLALAHSFLTQTKTFPGGIVWRLVAFILVFLGVLGFASYMIWQKQSEVLKREMFSAPGKEYELRPRPQHRGGEKNEGRQE